MAVADTASSSGKSASGSARPRSSRTCAKAFTQPFQASKVLGATVLLAPIAINSVASCPTAHYLVQTDPAFTNYRQWLSSDYTLKSLSQDPSVTQKRLGDGFYEQQLIREQVAQLTGQRFFGNYTSDEQQYQGLMDSGLSFAKAFNRRPGIALSAAQIASLSTAIVWLEQQTVTLPGGGTSQALVPRVYAAIRDGDLAPPAARSLAATRWRSMRQAT